MPPPGGIARSVVMFVAVPGWSYGAVAASRRRLCLSTEYQRARPDIRSTYRRHDPPGRPDPHVRVRVSDSASGAWRVGLYIETTLATTHTDPISVHVGDVDAGDDCEDGEATATRVQLMTGNFVELLVCVCVCACVLIEFDLRQVTMLSEVKGQGIGRGLVCASVR